MLWEVSAGRGPTRFRCESGHAYSPASLAEGQTEAVEEAMWAALRALEDRAELARTRGRSAAARGLHALAARFATQADAAQVQGAAIRDVLRLDGPDAVRPEVAVALPDEPSPGGDRPGDPAPADERTSAA